MRLELSGEQSVTAPIETVWQRLMDPQFVASCAPGVETGEPVDDTHYLVIAGLGVGSIKLRFTLHVELLDLAPPTRARMAVRGDAPGSAARAESSATLTSLTTDSTRLDWTVAADVHGTIANVGARLLGGTVGRLTGAFWKKFAAHAARGAKSQKTKKKSKPSRRRE